MSGPDRTKVIDGQLCRLVTPNLVALGRFLKRSFQIPAGCDFALILAPEGPACNDACLRQWVKAQMIDIATHPVKGMNLMVTLEERLLDELSNCLPYETQIDLNIPSPFAQRSLFPLPYWAPIPVSVATPINRGPEGVSPLPSTSTTQRSSQ